MSRKRSLEDEDADGSLVQESSKRQKVAHDIGIKQFIIYFGSCSNMPDSESLVSGCGLLANPTLHLCNCSWKFKKQNC